MSNFNHYASIAIFHLLETIIARTSTPLKKKLRFVNIAKSKFGACSEEEIAGAFVRLHYRLSELAKFDGELHEVDAAIGREDPEKVDAFVRSVQSSYAKFFNNYHYSDSEAAGVDPASGLTASGETITGDVNTAKTDSLFTLASIT